MENIYKYSALYNKHLKRLVRESQLIESSLKVYRMQIKGELKVDLLWIESVLEVD